MESGGHLCFSINFSLDWEGYKLEEVPFGIRNSSMVTHTSVTSCLDYCKVFRGEVHENVLEAAIVSSLSKAVVQLYHSCPSVPGRVTDWLMSPNEVLFSRLRIISPNQNDSAVSVPLEKGCMASLHLGAQRKPPLQWPPNYGNPLPQGPQGILTQLAFPKL